MISSEIQDIYPVPIENRTIKVAARHVDRLIGKLSAEGMDEMLRHI